MKKVIGCAVAVLIAVPIVLYGEKPAVGKSKTGLMNQAPTSKSVKTGTPLEINYQGWLGSATDTTAVSGAYNMIFRIYDASTGGDSLWGESQSSVQVDKGIFNVLLGSVNPLPDSFFTGSTLYLETQVGKEILSPRKDIVNVAYAIRSYKSHHSRYADTASYIAAANVNGKVAQAVRADTAGYVIGGINGKGASGYVAKFKDSSTVDTSIIYISGDSVGIGTKTPSEKLEVEGGIKSVGTGSGQVAFQAGYTGGSPVGLRILAGGDVQWADITGSFTSSIASHSYKNITIDSNLIVTGRVNNAAFRSNAVYNGNSMIAVDMAGNNMDQGELHFGNTGNNQWVDMWFIYSNAYLMGNYIKYDGSSTTTGHFRVSSSGVILYSNSDSSNSAGHAYWDATNKDVLIYEDSAGNNYCEWWSYDRRM